MRRSSPRCRSQLSISAATFGAIAGQFAVWSHRPLLPAQAGPEFFAACSVLDSRFRGNERSICPRPLPFLNRLESGNHGGMAKRVVDVLVPVALDQALFVPGAGGARACAGRHRLRAARRARRRRRWCGRRTRSPIRGLDNRLKDVEEKLDLPPLKRRAAPLRRLGGELHGGSRGMVLRMCLRMGEHLGAERERVGVRLAGPPPQRLTGGPPARARAARRRHGARQGRCGARSRA